MCNGKLHLQHKAGIEMGDPRWMTHCQFCGEPAIPSNPFCYAGGQYHQKGCYDVLFDYCEQCGQENMSVPVNEHYGKEKLCDKCRDKKHGWSTATILFR
jgi:hypothetical protein